MHRYLEYRSLGKMSNQSKDVQRRHVYKSRAGSEYLYVFGNLLSQGYYREEMISIFPIVFILALINI